MGILKEKGYFWFLIAFCIMEILIECLMEREMLSFLGRRLNIKEESKMERLRDRERLRVLTVGIHLRG